MRIYARILSFGIFFVLLSACGGGGGSDPATSNPPSDPLPQVSLSGTITYDFIPHNIITNGLDFDGATPRPVRGAVVSLLNASNTVLDSVITDSVGRYQFTVDANTNLRVRVNAQILSEGAPAWNFSVTDNTNGNALYVLQGALSNSGSTDSIRNLHAQSGWTGTEYSNSRNAAPFAILDTIYETVQLVLAVDADVNFPSAEFRWSVNNVPSPGNLTDGDIGTSSYVPSEESVYILGAADIDTDEFDKHVVAHEWCHYLEDRLSRTDSLGGSHNTVDRLDMRVAFSEGMCNAIAGMVFNDPVYRDSFGNDQLNGFSIDVENDSSVNQGWYNEASVAAILYDIFDDQSDGSDTVSDGFSSIYNVLISSDFRTSNAFTSIHLLLAEMKQQFPDLALGIDSLAAADSVSVNDIFGSGETNNGGDANVLPIYKIGNTNGIPTAVCSSDNFGTFNRLANRAFLRFTISNPATYNISVTRISGSLNSNPDFILWKQGVAQATRDSSVLNSEISSESLSPGDYLLEVYEEKNVFTENSNSTDVCFNVVIN